MSKPDVSVVLPTFNNEATIGRALASILLQQNCDFEVVVVDDCSTDRTSAILAQFESKDPRVRVLRTPRNSGEGFSRSLGIRHSVGEFVAAQDGDDISLPARLQMQSEYLLTHPDIHWVATWAYTMTSAAQLLQEITTPTNPETIRTRLVQGQMCIVGASVMVRRQALLDCRGYREVPTPDYDLARRFVERYAIAALPSPLYAYTPVLQSRQQQRYRAMFRLMLRHYHEYGGRRVDGRFLTRLLWNGLQGFVPLAPRFTRVLHSSARNAPALTSADYVTWLQRLREFERQTYVERESG